MQQQVKFLRGSQAAFDALVSNQKIIDGTFYLTTDTHKLYVGQSVDETTTIAVLINSTSMTSVSSQEELVNIINQWKEDGTEDLHNGDIFYIQPYVDPEDENEYDGNQLVAYVKDGDTYKIVQINADNEWKPDQTKSSLAYNGTTGTLDLLLYDENESGVALSTDALKIKIGENSYLLNDEESLPVYTKDEVDSKIEDELKALDGMTYVGTLASGSEEDPNGTWVMTDEFTVVRNNEEQENKPIHAGDMFLVLSQDGVKYGENDTDVAYTGDLLIATGQETDGVLTEVVWEYVPSANDITNDTTYTFTVDANTNKMVIAEQPTAANATNIASIKIASVDNNPVEVAYDLTNNNYVATISHSQVDVATSSAEQSINDDNSVVKAVSEIATDDYGHITSISTTNYSIPKYALTENVSLNNIEYVALEDGTVVFPDATYFIKVGEEMNQFNATEEFVYNSDNGRELYIKKDYDGQQINIQHGLKANDVIAYGNQLNLATNSLYITANNSNTVAIDINWGNF